MRPDPHDPLLDPGLAGRLQLHLRTRIDRLQRLGDAAAEAEARRRLAAVARHLDQPAEALAQLQALLGLHLRASQWLAAADVLMTCAELLLHLGHLDDARVALEEARRLYLGQRDVAGLALSEILQADLHLRLARDDDALACLLRAMEGLTDLGLSGPLAHVWVQLARFHHRRNQHKVEDAALSAAVDCFHLDGKPLQAALCQIQRAARLGQRGLNEDALATLDDVDRLLTGVEDGRAPLEIRAALDRGRLLDAAGRSAEALRALRKVTGRIDEAGDKALTADILELHGGLLAREAADLDALSAAELLLGRAVDLHIERKQPARVLDAARKIVEAAQRLGDLHLARRWAVRAATAAGALTAPKPEP